MARGGIKGFESSRHICWRDDSLAEAVRGAAALVGSGFLDCWCRARRVGVSRMTSARRGNKGMLEGNAGLFSVLVSDLESKGSRFPGGETAPVGSDAFAFARGC